MLSINTCSISDILDISNSISTFKLQCKWFLNNLLNYDKNINTHTHTLHTPTRAHKRKKEKKKDHIIECLIILMPNFINPFQS